MAAGGWGAASLRCTLETRAPMRAACVAFRSLMVPSPLYARCNSKEDHGPHDLASWRELWRSIMRSMFEHVSWHVTPEHLSTPASCRKSLLRRWRVQASHATNPSQEIVVSLDARASAHEHTSGRAVVGSDRRSVQRYMYGAWPETRQSCAGGDHAWLPHVRRSEG